MKKLYIIFVVSVLYQVNVLAQFEFFNNQQQQKISSTQNTQAYSVNVDSVMLDSIITAYKNLESIPGIATLIIKDDKVIWYKNYGYRNLELQLPVEDSTLFLMASISKTFLATAIMQLWENGLIDLEGNINAYLPTGFTITNPYYPNDTIIVKMLMTHSSSLIDNWIIIDPLNVCGDSPMRIDSFLVNYFTPGGSYYNINNFSNYSQGQKYDYSNTASCLLSLMIEHLSGKSFDEYTRDSIFIPLSMNSTSWFLTGLNTSEIAISYDSYYSNCHIGMPFYPVGQLRTNKFELSNFVSAYINGGIYNNKRILDSSTIQFIFSDHLGFPNSYGETQGLIWFNAPPLSKNTWGHTGHYYGCSTAMYLNPDENWGIIYFFNERFEDEGYWSTIYHLGNYAHFYGNIYAQNPYVDKPYARINIDPVLFRTKFSNIQNHQFTPHLIYANFDSTQIDSITLFDDGLHGDSLSNDGLYGSYISPRQTEDYFSLSVSTIDNQTNKYFSTQNNSGFTTAGPLVVDSIFYAHLPAQKRYSFKPFILNLGTLYQ